MGRVSRKKLDEEVKKELEEQLAAIIASLFDKGEITVFLNEFLTNEEKVMLGKRLVLYMLLEKEVASEDIEKALGTTRDTVRLYKLLLHTKPVAFRKSIQRLIKREKAKELWKKIGKAMAPLELVLNMKTNMKARSRFMRGEWFEDGK